MTYQVLARKLRPANFSELVGQDHVVQALSHALDNDRLHHAYLFTGTRGVGKTTVARILAKCFNCERGVSATPCGECDACVGIAQGRSVDLIEMDGASHRGVEDVQELQDNAQYMPNSARFKVFLIDEVHMLTTHAFNALLKILEEPPEHVKFLFATTEVKKLPITILSRCLQFQLKNMSIDAITGHLTHALSNEQVPFDDGALRIIATAAAGSMRDALSVTDQAISYGGGELSEASVAAMLGVTGRDEVIAVLDALADRAADRVLGCVAELAQRGIDFSAVLQDLLAAFHEIAVHQLVPDSAGGTESSIGARYGARLTPEAVQLHYQIALRSHRDLAFSPDPRIGFEMALLRMLSFDLTAPPDSPAPPSPASPVADGAATSTGGKPEGKSSSAAALRDTPAGRAAGQPAAAARRTTVASDGPLKEQAQQLRAAETAKKPESVTLSDARTATLKDTAESTQPAAVNAPPDTLPRAPDSFWYDLLGTLPTKGVVAMLMWHSRLLTREAGGAQNQDSNESEQPRPAQHEIAVQRWHLGLDPAHDAMLNSRHPLEMQNLLSAARGEAVSVHLTVEPLAWETPSIQLARERLELRQAAIAELRENADVVALLDAFGGAQLDESTIEAIEPTQGPSDKSYPRGEQL